MTLTAACPPANTLVARAGALATPLVVAAAVFWVAFDGGGYGVTSRSAIAIVVWWAIVLGVGLSVWPLARIPGVAMVAAALIAALALVTALSMLWADSAERAFEEADRIVVDLGVFALAVLASTRANAARWSDGIALGIIAVALLALASRFFQDAFPKPEIAPFLPVEQTRLNYPLNYWNGLAFLVALACPLLLRAAVASENRLGQALALTPFPALAATVYLTSSRGGTASCALGVVAFAALTARRWAAAGAIVVAVAGSYLAVNALIARDELVNGPLDSSAAESQGRSAALIVLLACLATGLVYALLRRYLPRAVRVGPRVGWAATAIVVAVALLGIAASDPRQRFEEFKKVPSDSALATDDPIGSHLTSPSGNGRWQWWASAVDQFREHPLVGDGAGSYEAWWAQHASIASFVRDAHSLYLEMLGELGIVGFLLVVGIFGVGIVAGATRLRGSDSDRALVAAVLAAFLAYALGAGVDWMWEIPAVSLVAFALLGLLVGPATAVTAPSGGVAVGRAPRKRRFVPPGVALAVIAVAPLLVAAEAIPLLSTLKIRASQEAVSRGDAGAALDDALAARKLEPWAASPHLQLALVEEEIGDLGAARRWIGEAIERDRSDWRLWLVRARLETKSLDIAAARRSLDRAEELNPRSPLFAGRG
ncbi:MAG: O-antigen ligase family protein [Actinomycetota bacterium]|nr:O-antigen ligase family protein [Actinomycetota bacterium]